MSIRILRPRLPRLQLARNATPPSITTSLNQPFLSTPHNNNDTKTHITRRPLSATSSAPDHLTAHRTLPYPALTLFNLITDIQSYPSFIPFLTSAHIDTHSAPDAHYQRKWPHKATLRIGYGDQINETFTSSVYCIPPIPEKGRAGVGIVEAISGSATHALDPEMIGHHLGGMGDTSSSSPGNQDPTSGPLEFLRSRWTVRAFPFKPAPADGTPPQEGRVEPDSPPARESTDVSLSLEFRFRNVAYEMMGKAVAGSLAERMIEVFVKRVEEVVGQENQAP